MSKPLPKELTVLLIAAGINNADVIGWLHDGDTYLVGLNDGREFAFVLEEETEIEVADDE